MFTFIVLVALLVLPPQNGCQEWQDCRQRALDAAARQEYETFHDLAWRTVQRGPKNSPELMHLLARAQSLSGRPHDALVMLRRLFDMGVPTDAPTHDDFRGVRALAGWSELEAALAGRPAAPTPEPEHKPAVSAASARVAAPAIAVARLTPGSAVAPAGLAYDAISKRFIIGDAVARKLKVVDEFSQRIVTLAGEEAAGFGDITALEIDTRQGDLWVASAGAAGDPAATLHKLQLISARQLEAFKLPGTMEPGRFVDVAVTADSVVLALDNVGGRLFRVRPRTHAMDLVATLKDAEPASIAPAGAILYVAHRGGLTRVDAASGTSATVGTAKGIDIGGLSRIRWHRGSLVAIQKGSGPNSRVVRIRLDRAGRVAVALEVLDPEVRMSNATAAAITDDVLYYLAAEGTDSVIRRIDIR
jgi:hypothetical protein